MLVAWHNFKLFCLIWLVALASTILLILFVLLLSLFSAFMLILRAGHIFIVRLWHLFNIDAAALDSDCPSALDCHFTNVAFGRRLFLLFNHRSLLLRVCSHFSSRWRHVPIGHLHCI